MSEFLEFIGLVTLLTIGFFLIAGILYEINEMISRTTYAWRVRHRFNKPPTAKCYCRDCKSHDPDTHRCYRFGETTKEYRCTADYWFCWEADPRKKEDEIK
jgi:hypothetical protein